MDKQDKGNISGVCSARPAGSSMHDDKYAASELKFLNYLYVDMTTFSRKKPFTHRTCICIVAAQTN